MSGGSGPAVGTAFHPQAEPAFNGAARSAGQPVALARLPNRRRPGMIALAVALIGAGILANTAFYRATNHRVPVLVAQADVPAGAVITSSDVGTASISASAGVQVIAAGELRQVVGHVAGTALHAGMLLTSAELARQQPPAPGQVLVPLAVRPSALPASGLRPSDHVLVVPTPGAQGQSGSTGAAPELAVPVPGIVAAVSSGPGADGFCVVDVLVPYKSGPSLAAQASTGQFAIVITRRSPA